MRTRSKILGAAMLAALCSAAISNTAQAKTIWGWFLVVTPASTPAGVTFTANGLGVWDAAYGFDSFGVVVCGVRPSANGATSSLTCPVTATTFQASIRTLSATFCSTAKVNWNGATVGCQTPSIRVTASPGGVGNYVLAGFARGFGN